MYFYIFLQYNSFPLIGYVFSFDDRFLLFTSLHCLVNTYN